MTPDPLREAAQAVADTSPGNYGFIAKWQRLRIVLDETAAQPAPPDPLREAALVAALEKSLVEMDHNDRAQAYWSTMNESSKHSFIKVLLDHPEVRAALAQQAQPAPAAPLPSYIDREWLDAEHPVQYGFLNGKATLDVNNPNTRERMNRCPKCEEWSPCRVRTLFEIAAVRPAPAAPLPGAAEMADWLARANQARNDRNFAALNRLVLEQPVPAAPLDPLPYLVIDGPYEDDSFGITVYHDGAKYVTGGDSVADVLRNAAEAWPELGLPAPAAPLDRDALGTCDWGDCDSPAIVLRHADGHGWLPVCRIHAVGNPSAEPYYLPMDCPVCGRRRMEWDGRVLSCEKCTTSSEWDGFSSDRYQTAPAAPLDREKLARALHEALYHPKCDGNVQRTHRPVADAIADAYEEDKP